MQRKKLGELLVDQGALQPWQLDAALVLQQRTGERIGDVLVGHRLATEEQVIAALGRQWSVPIVHIGDRVVPRAVVTLVPERLLRQYEAFPVGLEHGRGLPRLAMALVNPLDLAAVDALAFAAGYPLRAMLAGRSDVEQAQRRHLTAQAMATRGAPTQAIAFEDGDSGPMELTAPGGYREVDD
jgi:hypothetical protein